MDGAGSIATGARVRGAKRRGFTLIELLIVVAIIAILAAIALPNFLQAQVRAKVSRVQNDLRTIAVGLELYAVEYTTFPEDFEKGFLALTSPIAFITLTPRDVFKKDDAIYHYGAGSMKGADAHPKNMFVIVSNGPDLDDDTHTVMEFPYSKNVCPYDPTNGTLSNGDLHRLNPEGRLRNYLSDANPDYQ